MEKSLEDKILAELLRDSRVLLVRTIRTPDAYYTPQSRPCQELYYVLAPTRDCYDPQRLHELLDSLMPNWARQGSRPTHTGSFAYQPGWLEFHEVLGEKRVVTSGSFLPDRHLASRPIDFAEANVVHTDATIRYIRAHRVMIYPTRLVAEAVVQDIGDGSIGEVVSYFRFPTEVEQTLSNMDCGLFGGAPFGPFTH